MIAQDAPVGASLALDYRQEHPCSVFTWILKIQCTHFKITHVTLLPRPNLVSCLSSFFLHHCHPFKKIPFFFQNIHFYIYHSYTFPFKPSLLPKFSRKLPGLSSMQYKLYCSLLICLLFKVIYHAFPFLIALYKNLSNSIKGYRALQNRNHVSLFWGVVFL